MTLSKRAQKLLQRLQDGEWYPAYDNHTPKAMAELKAAKLVTIRGRAAVVRACYVPIDYDPLQDPTGLAIGVKRA